MSHEKWWNFSLWMKGLTPDGHVSSSDLIGQIGTWWQWAPAIKLCWNLAGQLTWAPAAEICVWAGLAQLDFVVELLWAWLSLQNEEFWHGWYTWAFVVSWLWKNKHSSHKFCWEKYSWEMSNLYFSWARNFRFCQEIVLGFEHNVIVFAKIVFWAFINSCQNNIWAS